MRWHCFEAFSNRSGNGPVSIVVVDNSLVVEEALDFLSDLRRLERGVLVVGLLDSIVAPFVNEALEHSVGAQLVFLTEASWRRNRSKHVPMNNPRGLIS